MRKYIAVFITIICIALTNSYWLVHTPANISFEIDGSGSNYVELQLIRKGEITKASQLLELDDTSLFSDKLQFFKKQKYLKIAVYRHGKLSPITISKIKIGDRKFSDLENFVSDSAKLTVVDNELRICPPPESPYYELLYKNKINLKPDYHFDIQIFLIIMILSFLFSYKLVDYLADFKRVKSYSRIDILFVALFFLLLFIPMSKISDESISKTELRTLAQWKPMISNGEFNFEFGKNFDEWFNDRFRFREPIVLLHNQINYKIRKDYVEFKKTHLFKSNGYVLCNISYRNIFPGHHLYVRAAKNLARLNNFCEQQGVKLYVVALPFSSWFYKEYNLIYKNLPDMPGNILPNYLDKNINFIFPLNEFSNAAKYNSVYYKNDSHLTDFGSYTLYKTIVETMQKDFKDIEITPLNKFDVSYKNKVKYDWDRNFYPGGNYLNSGINAPELLKDENQFLDYKNINSIKINKGFPHSTFDNPNGKYKLFIFGNSMQESLKYFLTTNFKEIDAYRTNMNNPMFPNRRYDMEMKPYEKIIKKTKPDAVILIVYDSDLLNNAVEMYPEEDK